jgi:hypothetical protein
MNGEASGGFLLPSIYGLTVAFGAGGFEVIKFVDAI